MMLNTITSKLESATPLDRTEALWLLTEADLLALGQLDLGLSLAGPRPLGEDVEDHGSAVEHLDIVRQHTLQVSNL